MARECPHCGAKNSIEAEICQFCGKKFDEPVSNQEREVLLKQEQWSDKNKFGYGKTVSLSSTLTIWYKFICPFLIQSVFTFTIVMALIPMEPDTKLNTDYLSFAVIVFFDIAWIICYFKLSNFSTYKIVELDNQNLYISNYLDKIEVPRTELSNVFFTKGYFWPGWENPPEVKIEFKHKTQFGSKIIFIPKDPFLNYNNPSCVNVLEQ